MMHATSAVRKGRGRVGLSLALVLTLLLTAMSGLLVLPARAQETTTVSTYTLANTEKTPKDIGVGNTLGLRIGVGSSFDALAVSLPTWSTTDSAISMSLYRWNTNCATTEAGEPIVTTRHDPLADNQMAEIVSPEPLEAGEYYLLFHDLRGRVAVWAKPGNEISKALVYHDGKEEAMDLLMTVRFLGKNAPETPFTDLEPQVLEAAPNKRTDSLPEDSLYHQNQAMPDTWVFTDGLGRVALTHADVGDVREDKTVIIFYWTWHEDLGNGNAAVNTTEFIRQHPDAKNDYTHPAWKGTGHYCFWNEPLYGFYRTADTWVLRRQAELLANAGVDVVINDNTNGSATWKNGYTPLYETWLQAMEDGVASPKVSFMLPFGPNDGSYSQIHSLYNDIYAQGKYQELWYMLDGKPMLMAHSSNLTQSGDKEIKDFFTFRAGQPEYLIRTPSVGSWGWLSTFPQPAYYGTREQRKNQTLEQMTVGVAVNHNYVTHEITAMNGINVMGRSYTSTYENRYDVEGPSASLWGYNFSEQFDYALEVDPMILFITGWNEWHAWRQPTPWGGPNSKVNNALVDQFDNEFSRDIEPTKGELKDHYYYLLVNYIRKYKGCTPIPTPSTQLTVDMNGAESQWGQVAPYYASYINNINDRDNAGYSGNYYVETSGRNDIIGAQVARDDDYMYFHVECASEITAPSDTLWMNLYLDSDQENAGWESFDYVVRYHGDNQLTLEKFTKDGYATEKVADCAYTLSGRYLTIKVAKADMGLSGDDYTVNFAWTDNVHDEDDMSKFSGDILDFYISGDVAPGGRFKYSYISTRENSGKKDEETQPEIQSVTTEPVVTEPESDVPATEEQTVTQTLAQTETDVPAASGGCASSLTACGLLVCLPGMAWVLGVHKNKKKKKEKHAPAD